MNDSIHTWREGGVQHIQFNRPEKKNALTNAMYRAWADALVTADADPQVRAVVFSGAGGQFTAGNDLGDFLDDPPRGEDAPVFSLLQALVSVGKPLIAAVEGAAVGIGTTVLLHCDLAFASAEARFQMPFVSLGLCPEAASSLLLPARVGPARAAQWLLTGAAFGAAEAERAGLVNAVCETGQVLDTASQAARLIAAQPPAAVRLTRDLLRRPQRDAVNATLSEEGRLFVERLASAEAREAFAAFFEKRAPDFSRFQ